jgi:hypothetical protein
MAGGTYAAVEPTKTYPVYIPLACDLKNSVFRNYTWAGFSFGDATHVHQWCMSKFGYSPVIYFADHDDDYCFDIRMHSEEDVAMFKLKWSELMT